MKKITLTLFLLCLGLFSGWSQCINTTQFPSTTVVSNNSGLPQNITNCAYTSEYSVVGGLIVGSNYNLSAFNNSSQAPVFLTVTDAEGNVLISGFSPLLLEALNVDVIQIHYANNENCESTSACHTGVLQAIVACPALTNPIVSNVSISTADLTWTPGENDQTWEVLLLPSADPAPTADVSGVFVDVAEYQETALEPSSSYRFYVRGNCGDSFSSWVASPIFVTPCLAFDVPFEENFDSMPEVGFGLYPICWKADSTQFSTTNATTYNTAFSGANYLRCSWNAENEVIWTPGLNLEANVSYDLSFFAQGDGWSGWAIDVLWSTNTDIADATVFGTPITLPGNNAIAIQQYVSVRNAFVPTETGVYYFAIRVNQPSDTPWYVAFDDIKVDLTPSCVPPSGLAVAPGTLTANSATVTFVESDSAPNNGYQYILSSTNSAPVDGDPITGSVGDGITTFDLAGLEPETTYYVFVRSACGPDSFSDWSQPFAFTTACVAISEFPYVENFDSLATVGTNSYPTCWREENGDWTTSNATTYNTAYSGANYVRNAWSASNEFLWTKGFQLQAGTSYDFTFQCQGDGYAGWVVDVFVGAEQNSATASQFGNTYNVPGTANVASIQPYNLVRNTFVPTETGVYFFGIRVNQPNGAPWYVAFDDITVELTPSCFAPSGLAVEQGSVTSNSATIVFNEPVTVAANGYEYYIADNNATPDDFATPSGTIPAGATSVSLSDLNGLSTYYIWIRSVCSASDTSGWSSFASFTTLCSATELPWTEGFEGLTNGTIVPSCWLEENGDYSISNETTYNTAYSGTSYLRIQWSATNEFVWTPGFQLTAGTSYDFSFFCQGDGYTGWVMDAFVSQQQNSANAIQLGDSYSPAGDDVLAIQPYEQLVRTFTPETTGIYYFGIRTNQPSSAPWYSAFDDFSVSESLSVNNPAEGTRLQVYPNPVNDILSLKHNTNITNVAVFNIVGQQVLSQSANGTDVKINMSTLAAGSYIVKVTADNITKTVKVIKN